MQQLFQLFRWQRRLISDPALVYLSLRLSWPMLIALITFNLIASFCLTAIYSTGIRYMYMYVRVPDVTNSWCTFRSASRHEENKPKVVFEESAAWRVLQTELSQRHARWSKSCLGTHRVMQCQVWVTHVASLLQCGVNKHHRKDTTCGQHSCMFVNTGKKGTTQQKQGWQTRSPQCKSCKRTSWQAVPACHSTQLECQIWTQEVGRKKAYPYRVHFGHQFQLDWPQKTGVHTRFRVGIENPYNQLHNQ